MQQLFIPAITWQLIVITPPQVLFSLDFFVSLFLSLFLFLSATLRENGWTDLHEIFREGV